MIFSNAILIRVRHRDDIYYYCIKTADAKEGLKVGEKLRHSQKKGRCQLNGSRIL